MKITLTPSSTVSTPGLVGVAGAVAILALADKGHGVGVVVIVLFFEYTGNQLTAIRDASARRVEYRYDLEGNLTTFIDVLGNPWTYTYARNVYSDVKCEVRFEHRNGVLVEVFRSCVPVTIVEDKFRLVARTDPEGRILTRGFTANGFVGGLTYPDGTKTQYSFDYDSSRREHYLREQTPAGKVTESWLDEDGDVIRKDVNGRTVSTLVKDTVLRTRTETDARGLKTIREYDQFDNVTKITYPDLTSVSFTYDPVYANVLQNTDERSTVTKNEYDLKGNLTRLTEAVGLPEQRVTEYTYDAHGQRLTETKRGGTVTLPGGTTVSIADATTTFEYDTQGNVTAVIDAENFRTEFTYDVMGKALTKLDARLKLWTRTFDLAGRLTSETDPLNHTTAHAYDKTGLRIKITDAVLNATLYGYDLRGNLTTITDPYGGITRFEYNADNQQIKQTDQEGKSQTTGYDLDGRLSKQIDGNTNAIQYVYGDAAAGLDNLLVKVIYPTFSQEFKYDTRNHITEVIDAIDIATRQARVFTYDAAGNVASATDPVGRTTRYSYDGFHLLKTITDSIDGVTEMFYDRRSNLVAVRDAKGNTHRFEHDRQNRMVKEIDYLGQTISYVYDPVGNLVRLTDRKGQVKNLVYDDTNRLVQETHFLTAADAISNTNAAKSVTYTYNVLDRLAGYSDGTSTGTYTYDVQQTRKVGESVNYGTFSLAYTYTYKANGQKASVTYPDGASYSYTYDADNQLTTVELPTGFGTITYNTYNWFAPTRVTLPGGTVHSRDYDPLLRLKSLAVKDATQNEVLNYQYAYDPANNVTARTTEHGQYAWNYDKLDRLTSAANPSSLPTEGYTYDAVGNRLTDSKTANTWTYNENNQLIVFDGVTYEYDANGNTIKKTDANNSANTRIYVYDTSDRLIEVRDANNVLIAAYSYDPFGRRLTKDVNSTKTFFFYADEGLIAEASAGGTVTRSYGYAPDSLFTTDPLFLKTSNAFYFYQSDHLGVPQMLIGSDGQVVWSAVYEAFGNATIDPASIITSNLRFPGQYYDAETGLIYNYFRYYDPATGRYITRDPIGLDGGINVYAYVENNPLNRVDPTGEFGPIGAAFGFGASVTIQMGLCFSRGGDLVTCLKCIDIVDAGISALQGAFFPTWIGNVGKSIVGYRKAKRAYRAIGGQAEPGLAKAGQQLQNDITGALAGTIVGGAAKARTPSVQFGCEDECEQYRLGPAVQGFVTSVF